MEGSESKIQYGFVDVIKFLLALLIVSAHFISENAVGRINSLVDYGSSMYVIVVPFFFACSGFLLFRKLDRGEDNWDKVKAYCKKLLIMYAGWSAVYFLFTVLTWIRFGSTAAIITHYFLHCVTYSTYKTIWFLPAAVVGVLFTYCLTEKIGIKGTIIVGIVFYFIGCLGSSYSFLVHENKVLRIYNYIFSSTRNGFFNGFPFVLIGYLIAKKEKKGFTCNLRRNLFFTTFFGVTFIVEALAIKKHGAVNVNTLIFLVPFTFFFLMLCLGVRMATTNTVIWFRRMSTDVFLCQRIYLTALPTLFPGSVFEKLLIGNPYVGWVAMLLLSLFTSAILINLSNKSRWLTQFC